MDSDHWQKLQNNKHKRINIMSIEVMLSLMAGFFVAFVLFELEKDVINKRNK